MLGLGWDVAIDSAVIGATVLDAVRDGGAFIAVVTGTARAYQRRAAGGLRGRLVLVP